jgi:hypothetical protein
MGIDYIPKPGKLGDELTIKDGYDSARLMLLNHLAMAKSVLGDLSLIDRPITSWLRKRHHRLSGRTFCIEWSI